MTECWYALQVKPRGEKLCTTLLTQKGYEVFLPCYTRRSVRRGQVTSEAEPLFPGYLFCRITDRSIGKMVTTPGAVRIVACAGQPVPVDEEEIHALQRLASSDVARRPWRYLPNGCRVEISSGPLAGVRGILLTENNRSSVAVSVSLLQRSVIAEVGEETILRPIDVPSADLSRKAAHAHVAMSLLGSQPYPDR